MDHEPREADPATSTEPTAIALTSGVFEVEIGS